MALAGGAIRQAAKLFGRGQAVDGVGIPARQHSACGTRRWVSAATADAHRLRKAVCAVRPPGQGPPRGGRAQWRRAGATVAALETSRGTTGRARASRRGWPTSPPPPSACGVKRGASRKAAQRRQSAERAFFRKGSLRGPRCLCQPQLICSGGKRRSLGRRRGSRLHVSGDRGEQSGSKHAPALTAALAPCSTGCPALRRPP